MLHIGIDDTDSIKGGCTTWLATEIIAELSEFDLIGPPRLVRLNPNVPWKTRGNAAVALTFGKGVGSKTLVGEFGKEKIYMYTAGRDMEYNKHAMLERISALVMDGSMPDSQPGIVISDVFLPEGLYWQGVTNIVTEEILSDAIEGAISQGYRGSRGIYGAACSIAWTGSSSKSNGISHTWELIGYREKEKWGSKRDISASSVHEIGHLDGVFSCHDSDGKVAMVPNSPCPVLWGFRGTEHKTLIDNFDNLGPEKPFRWILYKTNQATDDHLRTMEISDISDGDSVWLEVVVSSKPNVIKGGHRFFKVSDSEGATVKCAAFEPSKTFRHAIDSLEVGDILIICGSFKKDTINLEKIRLLELTKRFSKSANPVCDCGRRTHSSGKGMHYRCKVCGKKYDRPEMIEITPDLEIGWYEPPASARRHLTTPISLMR
ncbi:MAG: tRNA(Ile)(2)-agmatinylcytidine synthase [Candidatus Peribacteraceae bacterium]|jgi:tRNA(Ile2)-agmatinylcytidine synthase|nr:tRNA(Ile)(2)-agmatinylcytidine synthase [Candidatus Peribacteraceae bacterium]